MKSLDYLKQRRDRIFFSCKRIRLSDVWKRDCQAGGSGETTSEAAAVVKWRYWFMPRE